MPHPTQTTPQPVAPAEWDDFEQGLLCVARHVLMAMEQPQAQSWHRAYTVAAERWTETLGLSVAHHLQKLVRAVLQVRGGGFACLDPRAPEARGAPTADECDLIDLLHHMRRDQTRAARRCVESLTQDRMDPDVIRAGLRFAMRFPAGQPARPGTRPALHVVR